jgi:hypothetical protein
VGIKLELKNQVFNISKNLLCENQQKLKIFIQYFSAPGGQGLSLYKIDIRTFYLLSTILDNTN